MPDEGQMCRLPRVTEKAATYEKKVESLFLCLSKNCRQSGFYKNLAATKMIIFKSILNTFKLSTVFRGSWVSSVNWHKPKFEPPSTNLACPNL